MKWGGEAGQKVDGGNGIEKWVGALLLLTFPRKIIKWSALLRRRDPPLH